MNVRTMLFATSVGLALSAMPAHAGPCSLEIETLAQAHPGAGAHLPKAPSTSGHVPDNPLDTTIHGGNLATAGAIPKAPSTAGTLPENPLSSSSGANGAIETDGTLSASLQRARELDQAGDEAGCMNEIAKAKQLLGTD
jgi:hypothetical protein